MALMGRNEIVAVVSRDALGAPCVRCTPGIYREVSAYNDSAQLMCLHCGDTVDRWMTKREMLRHIVEVGA